MPAESGAQLTCFQAGTQGWPLLCCVPLSRCVLASFPCSTVKVASNNTVSQQRAAA